MKKLCLLALCVVLAAPLLAQAQPDVSYSLGMIIGANVKSSNLKLDIDSFIQGIRDVLNGKAKYSNEQAQTVVQAALQGAAAKKGADNLSEGKAFLESNRKKAGITTTASGLQYEVLVVGKGATPKATDTVKVNYEGKLLDGTVFDSSYARKAPATFPLSGVIRGWTEGVQLMPVGSKYRFYVPSELGYGQQGAANTIGPNAVLIFEIELLSIETGK